MHGAKCNLQHSRLPYLLMSSSILEVLIKKKKDHTHTQKKTAAYLGQHTPKMPQMLSHSRDLTRLLAMLFVGAT